MTTLGKFVDLSDHYVDLSDIKLTSRLQLGALTGYENNIFSHLATSCEDIFWQVGIII